MQRSPLLLVAVALVLTGCGQAEALAEDPTIVAERRQQLLDEVITDQSRMPVERYVDKLVPMSERERQRYCDRADRKERMQTSDMGMVEGVPQDTYADQLFDFPFIACVQLGVIDVLPS